MKNDQEKPIDGNISINIPDQKPNEVVLPSGKQVTVSRITLTFVESIYKSAEGADDDGVTFTQLATEVMLRENSEQNLSQFSSEDRDFLILQAVKRWGCQEEFDELGKIFPIEKRFYMAARLQLQRTTEIILQSVKATQDMLAKTVSAITAASSSQIQNITASIGRMAQSLIVPVPDFSGLFSSVDRMLQAYPPALENLYSPNYLDVFSQALPRIAQVEMHNALVVENHLQGVETEETIIEVEGVADLGVLLDSLDPALVPLFRGAEEAVYSDNPDKARHFASSHRELDIHVIDFLAPKTQVSGWTKDPNHYKNGEPTRRAQLLFIARNAPAQAAGLVQFYVADGLTQFKLLNYDVHEIDNTYSKDLLFELHKRYTGWLHTLLLVASGAAFTKN